MYCFTPIFEKGSKLKGRACCRLTFFGLCRILQGAMDREMQVFSGVTVPPAVKAYSSKIVSWLERSNPPEWATVMGTALLVGLGAGLGAVVFHLLIETSQWLFFDLGSRIFAFLGDYYVLVIPALGGLVGGPLVYFFAREAKGHGVPEVMEAVALKGGRIRPRVAVVKSLASSICIGSGGSVGSEGPIVQIGAALGSTVGQFLRLSDERIQNLVACGAAGGIAAVFNAPIAGTIFALEVILGEFRSTYFGAVVMSAVIADVVVHAFEGAERAFSVPAYELFGPSELILYALLGVAIAPISVLYSHTIDRMEDVFDNWKQAPDYLKAMIGGLLVGVLGVLVVYVGTQVFPDGNLTLPWESNGLPMPSMFGVGYEIVNFALLGKLTFGAAVALMVLKLMVTGLTLGSGGSGGIFAPALFMGAMVGAAFGFLVNQVVPGHTGPIGAYALVGMAAFFAGTAHAPATSILILFEMTGDYNIILPLMFATVISLLISRAIEPESIYTLKLAKRGIRLHGGRDVDLLEGVTVGETMHRDYEAVEPDMPLAELIAAFESTHHHGFPVVEPDGKLFGIVTLTDLSEAMHDNHIEGLTVRDIATSHDMLVAYPDETLATAMLRMGVRGVGRLPVVSRDDPTHFEGMVRRESVILAYNRAIAQRSHVSRRLRALQQHSADNVSVIEVKLAAGMECVGQTLSAFSSKLPEDCIVASIQRGKRLLIPHGSSRLEANDRLTILVANERVEQAKRAFC
jgi:CIC family chloride channel protein